MHITESTSATTPWMLGVNRRGEPFAEQYALEFSRPHVLDGKEGSLLDRYQFLKKLWL